MMSRYLILIAAGLLACNSPYAVKPHLDGVTTITIKAVSASHPYESNPIVSEEGAYTLNTSRCDALVALLNDTHSYHLDKKKACLFIPQYALIITGSMGTETYLYSAATQQLQLPSKRILDCDPAATQLTSLITNQQAR